MNYSALNLAYQNRARELVDLLFDNEHYGWRQTDQLVDEMAAVVANSYNGLRFIDAERAMWENHPRVSGTYKNLWYKNNEWFVQSGHQLTWDYMAAYYKQYLTQTGMSGFLNGSYGLNTLIPAIADSANIPVTPTITYAGSDSNYAVNTLTFQASAFSDPQGSGTFAATKWRIAEVEPYTPIIPVEPGQPYTIDLITTGQAWNYFIGSQEPSTPISQWRQIGFDDTSWVQNAAAPFGYGSTTPAIITNLYDDMYNKRTSVYFRKTFNVSNSSDIESLTLNIHYDEGFNVWINGTHVGSANVSGQELPCTATAVNNIYPGQPSTVITLPTPSSYLVTGTNVIAVQLLNYVKSSSDLLWELSMTANYPAAPSDPVPPQKVKRGKYEIEPVWESPEITNASQLTVQIPAGVVKPGKLYRVRSRMKDNTGRWSHWSSPVEFTAGLPLSNGIIDDLRITEIMYNPPHSRVPLKLQPVLSITMNSNLSKLKIAAWMKHEI